MYNTNDIVFIGGAIFKAKTNLSAGAFNGDDWTQITSPIDYIGYVPNNTEILPIFDSADPSTVLDQGGLFNFSSIEPNFSRSSARSIFSGEVPNIGAPEL